MGKRRRETSTLTYMFHYITCEETLQVPPCEGQEARKPVHYCSAIDF